MQARPLYRQPRLDVDQSFYLVGVTRRSNYCDHDNGLGQYKVLFRMGSVRCNNPLRFNGLCLSPDLKRGKRLRDRRDRKDATELHSGRHRERS